MISKNRATMMLPKGGLFGVLPTAFFILSAIAISFAAIRAGNITAIAAAISGPEVRAKDPARHPAKNGKLADRTATGSVAEVNDPDSQLLSLTIISPVPGTVAGTIDVTANLSGDAGIENVQFLLN